MSGAELLSGSRLNDAPVNDTPEFNVHFHTKAPERIPYCRRSGWALGRNYGESKVIGREYFLRQAATLLKFAQSTNDPKLAAALIEKASNLLAQIDESSARPDPTPLAPDVEPPPA